MEFHTLTSEFVKDVVIDEFESGIWTERYTKPGDVKLILPATRERTKQLAPGKFLSLKGSKEVMLLDTQLIEDNTITVTGNTLEKFLDERVVQLFVDHDSPQVNPFMTVWKLKDTPAKTMAQIVQDMVISSYHIIYNDVYRGGAMAIDNLVLGPIFQGGARDTDGTPLKFSTALSPGEPLHAALLKIAEEYHLGMSLYLGYANDEGYELRFTVYKGIDRTGPFVEANGDTRQGNDLYPIVRFSPELDSYTNIKELRSNEGYKTEVTVTLPDGIWAPSEAGGPVGMWPVNVRAFEVGGNVYRSGENFKARVASIPTKKVTDRMIKKALGKFNPDDPRPAGSPASVMWGDQAERTRINEIMYEEGKLYLAQNRRKRSIDGETVPQDYYRFGKDYRLGDIVEVEGYTGEIEKVRVTEYIRTHDETGERDYPTLSPVDLNSQGRYNVSGTVDDGT